MQDTTSWLAVAQRLQALAQSGLAYTTNAFDVERYEEIRAISVRMVAEISAEPVALARVAALFANETGYQTPKVDVRAVVFRGTEELLMVQETIDGGRWSLPGGWADVGLTPFEVAEKETWEETGLRVRAVRLLALFDKKKHPHPPQPWYVYKCFILCEVVDGVLASHTAETTGARWVPASEIAHLDVSSDRVTHSQLATILKFARQPTLPTLCD